MPEQEHPQETQIVVRDMNNPLDKPKEIESLLNDPDRTEELDALLAETGVSRERFVRTVVHALAASTSVMKASRASILLAVLEAARMGLEPTGAYGGGYLVVHKGAAVFWVDWRGYIKMAMRSGQLLKADPFVVYEKDVFDYELGTQQRIVHKPWLGPDEERGKPTHVYGIAWLSNGTHVVEVMSWDEVVGIMKRSSSKKDGVIVGPWVSDPAEMGRKTIIRRLFKRIPAVVSPQLEFALSREDERMDAAVSVEPLTAGRGRANEGRRGRILEALGGTAPETDPAEAEAPAEEAAATEAVDGRPADSEEGLPE